ncbi:hypothetical protein MTO96_048975 [Rhipicephalus appendiculatus]
MSPEVARNAQTRAKAAERPPPVRKSKADAAPLSQHKQRPLATHPSTKPVHVHKDGARPAKLVRPKVQQRPPPTKVAAQEANKITGAAENTFLQAEQSKTGLTFIPGTYKSDEHDREARERNYQRLSHFRLRRYQPRGKYVFEPNESRVSLWHPAAQETRTAEGATAMTLSLRSQTEYVVENYVHPPDNVAEQGATRTQLFLMGALVAVIIMVIVVWTAVAFLRRRSANKQLDEEHHTHSGGVAYLFGGRGFTP